MALLSGLPLEVLPSILQELDPRSIQALGESSQEMAGVREVPRFLRVPPGESLEFEELELFPNVHRVQGPIRIPEDDRVARLSRRIRGPLEFIYDIPEKRTQKFLELLRVRALLYPESRTDIRVKSKPRDDAEYYPYSYDRGALRITVSSEEEEAPRMMEDLPVTSLGVLFQGDLDESEYLSSFIEDLDKNRGMLRELIVLDYMVLDPENFPTITSIRYDSSVKGLRYYSIFTEPAPQIIRVIDAPVLLSRDPQSLIRMFETAYPNLSEGTVLFLIPTYSLQRIPIPFDLPGLPPALPPIRTEDLEGFDREVEQAVEGFRERHPGVQVKVTRES